MIGNRLDETTGGFIGFITDFRITFDNLCANKTIPNSRLTVTDKTALLISPVDTNPYADLSNKNNITNFSTTFKTDYPINLFTNKEDFQSTSPQTTSSVKTDEVLPCKDKTLKILLLLLLLVIFIILLFKYLEIIKI
jgi:hypothetical protein